MRVILKHVWLASLHWVKGIIDSIVSRDLLPFLVYHSLENHAPIGYSRCWFLELTHLLWSTLSISTNQIPHSSCILLEHEAKYFQETKYWTRSMGKSSTGSTSKLLGSNPPQVLITKMAFYMENFVELWDGFIIILAYLVLCH